MFYLVGGAHRYQWHIHHAIFGLCILPFCIFNTNRNVFLLAISVGLFLEGVTQWGFAGMDLRKQN